MSFIILSQERAYAECPPDDKPWLVSSAKALDEDKRGQQQYKDLWLEEYPYPGNNASKESKHDWIRDIHYQGGGTNGPKTAHVLKEVLYSKAPLQLLLEIRVSKQTLVEELTLKESQEKQFAANWPNHCRTGTNFKPSPSEISWSSYSKWLVEENQPNQDVITLGSILCSRDDNLDDKIQEFCNDLGLHHHLAYSSGVKEDDRLCEKWGLQDKVGENLHYCVGNGNLAAFAVKLGFWKPREKEMPWKEFCQVLKEQQRKTLGTSQPKMFRTLETNARSRKLERDFENDIRDDSPFTSDTIHVLWLPLCYKTYLDRISSHFSCGKGETRAIQYRLDFDDTVNLKVRMFKNELAAIKKLKTFQEKLCALLALTQVVSLDPHWLLDNECRGSKKLVTTDLASYWRTNLLKLDDATLGIGLNDEDASSADEPSESRKALDRCMEIYKNRFKDVGITFNLKVGHSRQPKKRVAETVSPDLQSVFSPANKPKVSNPVNPS
jgi:hypothetical protein